MELESFGAIMAVEEITDPETGKTRKRAIRREVICDCGRRFTQYKLSRRFLEMARHHAHAAGREAAIDREIPDGFVPLFCPPCETHQLELEARRDEWRALEIVDRTLEIAR